MLTGRCLCGGIRFEISGQLGPIIYCLCSMCRRASGSAFATNASVRASEFRVVQGAELLGEYQSSPGTTRTFCSRCGSPMFGRIAGGALIRVRLGTLDGDPGGRAVANIWVGSKAPWYPITDSLERFDEAAPRHYGAPA
ncbi:MAG TPA: GFA family protein [Candidatus Binatia bacterium]|nr:GFA family protein [Candidatus Binatia bacterium]